MKQIHVFRNAKKNKISVWDIICFVVFPIILAAIISLGFGCVIDKNLAGVLTTVFAFVFTVLFGFAAILVGKMDSSNAIERKVVGETFVSIMTSNILSLLSAVLSITIIMEDGAANKVISMCIYSLSFMIIMLLLMISKRTFVIYCNNQKD